MVRITKQVRAAIAERHAAKDRIRKKYGVRRLREAEKRLCDNCARRLCDLLPLTGRGEDCPYYQPKEGGKSV